MSDVAQAPAGERELVIITEKNSIEKTVGMPIVRAFLPHYEAVRALAESAKSINVTDATQVTEIKNARAVRLQLKESRIAADKVREKEKQVYLSMGKAIQGIFNRIYEISHPVEERLQAMEDFAELAEKKRIDEREAARVKRIVALGGEAGVYNVRDMPEENFEKLVKTLEDARDHQLEEARKLQEAQREIDELEAAERERARMENERLRKEAEAREAQLAEERRAADARVAEEKRKADEFFAAEKNRRDAEFRAQQAASDEKLRLERQEREAEQARAEERLRLERAAAAALQQKHAAEIESQRRELEAAQTAERERQAREAEIQSQERARQRMAAMAPDKDKLKAYCEAVIATPMPELESAEARALLSEFTVHFNKVMTWLSGRAKSL